MLLRPAIMIVSMIMEMMKEQFHVIAFLETTRVLFKRFANMFFCFLCMRVITKKSALHFTAFRFVMNEARDVIIIFTFFHLYQN